MLIVKVQINDKVIEDILIHNTGKILPIDMNTESPYFYEIINPERPSEKLIDEEIVHKRSDGYRPLLRRVLEELDNNKCETRTLKC